MRTVNCERKDLIRYLLKFLHLSHCAGIQKVLYHFGYDSFEVCSTEHYDGRFFETGDKDSLRLIGVIVEEGEKK